MALCVRVCVWVPQKLEPGRRSLKELGTQTSQEEIQLVGAMGRRPVL